MLRTFPSASRSVLVILLTAILAVAAGSGSSFAADDVTVYKIQNRWKQFIYDAGIKVAYDQGKGLQVPCDELDIIEAYGGEGPGHPNAFDTYMICPHAWNQGEAGKALEKKAFEGLRNPIRMRHFGIPSTWFEMFHTYGCKITESDTIYYCDNIEVGRHPTLPLSKQLPIFFLINLATGGGWPVDLSRYNGVADMYVDYVRVYQARKANCVPCDHPFPKSGTYASCAVVGVVDCDIAVAPETIILRDWQPVAPRAPVPSAEQCSPAGRWSDRSPSPDPPQCD